jgi:hypothetical protein
MALHQRVKAHPLYKGVRICKRWCGKNGFVHFLADMGARPKGTTLGRILDSANPGYCPSNCEWMTHVQQIAEKYGKKAQRILHAYHVNGKLPPSDTWRYLRQRGSAA